MKNTGSKAARPPPCSFLSGYQEVGGERKIFRPVPSGGLHVRCCFQDVVAKIAKSGPRPVSPDQLSPAQPSSDQLRSAQIICETAWNLSVKQHTAGRSGRGIFEVVQILMRYNEYVFKKMHLT